MELLYAVLIILVLICLLAIMYVFYYNRLQDVKLKIDEAETVIDESLRNKYDLIVDIKEIIDNKIKDNKISFKDLEILKDEKISNFVLDRRLNDYMNIIDKVQNDYKDLKNNNDIINKLTEMQIIDEKISSAKLYYNNNITESNALVKKFPSNIVAKFHNFEIKKYFDNKDLNDEDINDFKL